MSWVVHRGTGGREVVAVEERPDPSAGLFEVVIAPPPLADAGDALEHLRRPGKLGKVLVALGGAAA